MSKKTNLWEILKNNIYSIFDKSKPKAIKQMLLYYSWKLFIKIFMKVAVRHSKWKVFQKQKLLPSTYFYGARQQRKHNYINIKTTHPISLTFISNFLSFGSHVFVFFVFCISSNKLNSITCGICLSFKSRHLELFCKTIIQLFSTGIFLGLWSRGSPCNFTEQLFFLHSCEWLLPII